jgi:hypothetical protein
MAAVGAGGAVVNVCVQKLVGRVKMGGNHAGGEEQVGRREEAFREPQSVHRRAFSMP